MWQIATAFHREDGSRIYVEISKESYDNMIQQLEDEDWESFAKMEIPKHENRGGIICTGDEIEKLINYLTP